MASTPSEAIVAGRSSLSAAAPTRDTRLDVLRGVALIMIFINHVPGQIFEYVTTKNFGFSDAAEAFVLISGIAVGLAYGSG
ncbi:OpgC domain-containing protein, partial [Rhizobium sp.]